jgi:hypothetical protein
MTILGIGSQRLSIQLLLHDIAVEVASLNCAGSRKNQETHSHMIRFREYDLGIVSSRAFIQVVTRMSRASLQS